MSNEEILKKLNWTYDSDPGRFSLYDGLIKPAMNEARRDTTDSMSKLLMERDGEIKSLEREVALHKKYAGEYKKLVEEYADEIRKILKL